MRRSIQHLKPYYKAPREQLVRLDQNTNLSGRNPVTRHASLDDLEFNQYPTRDADDLLAALTHTHDLPAGCVLAGNGSDEVLDIILKAFTDPGDVLAVPAPSYSLYPFYAALNDLCFEQVPMTQDWKIDVEGLLSAGTDTPTGVSHEAASSGVTPKVILVASPNNPTGGAVPTKDLLRLVRDAPGIVVVDEAYIEYVAGQPTLLPHIMEHPNLIVMRTFSKAYGLAGARLGWMAAHPDTMACLGLVKPPFNINVVTERLGIDALADPSFMESSVEDVSREKPALLRALEGRGFKVVPSDANFLLTFPPVDALPPGPQLAALLHDHGIAARTFAKVPRLERSIRFTVGPGPTNERLLAALDTIRKEAHV